MEVTVVFPGTSTFLTEHALSPSFLKKDLNSIKGQMLVLLQIHP